MQEETAFVKNRITRTTKSLLSDGGVTPHHTQVKLGTYSGLQISLFGRSGFHPTVVAHQPSDPRQFAGSLVLAKVNREHRGAEFVVRSASVSQDFQGRGIGLAMYELTLKHFGALSSSEDLSVGSSKVWKTLVEKYDGHLVVPLISPTTYQITSVVNVGIVDWNQVSEFWWPKVAVGPKQVSLQELLRSRNKNEQASARASTYLVQT